MREWRVFRQLMLAGTLAAAATVGASAREPEVRAPALAPTFVTDFADPFVLPIEGGRYIAYATNPSGLRANVQMAASKNLRDWRLIHDGGKLLDALPVLPAWATAGKTWAPEVIQIGDRFVLYFTAQERRSGLQCVGVGVSDSAVGPFVSDAEQPLVCQRELGGSIDASAFRDRDGSLHLLWKSDGNNPRVLKPSILWSQPLSRDGLTLTGNPVELLRNTENWEWRVVESPTMVRDDKGALVLLYSANHFGWEADQRLSNYAMGYARCASVAGPCVKARENPVLKSYNDARGCLSGPGHQTVFESGGKPFIVFHAWAATKGCRLAHKGRHMYVSPLSWSTSGAPVVGASLRAK